DRKQKGYQAALAAAGQQRTQAEGAIRTLEANARRLRDLIKILTRRPDTTPLPPPRLPGGNKPWPLAGVGRAQVIRPFGSYQHPEYHVQVSSNGIDISVARGSTVKSIAAGTVVEVTNMQGYGTTLVIDHGNGAMSVYAYLGGMSVAKGARVAAGQAIGTTGVRPDDNIAALHLETYSNGTPQNPLGWLVAR
ncbi:MAG TPA: M23 family metallopeptidase, partial [bacterium]|nr:M23 family metallopeptidase [bacterium]